MTELLHGLLRELAGNPALQGVVAALATFILEDPTTITCGLLVADRSMAFWTAMVGVSTGIAVGDMGLYGFGRIAGPRLVGRGPLTAPRVDRASRWFARNLVSAVLASRFVPGLRLPTYLAAGVLRAPWWRFVTVVVAASLLWTLLLLQLTVAVGERVLPLLGRYRWPAAAVAVLLLALAQRWAAARVKAQQEQPQVSSWFEFWPPWLFYLPVVGYWLWLAVRHRGLLLPTVANPSIYSGGFIGESKSDILALLPDTEAEWVARWTVVERRGDACDVQRARQAMTAAGLCYPVVAKPDVGQRGAGVRPLAGDRDLDDYVAAFPIGSRFLLQEMVPSSAAATPGTVQEAGVLYWRMPGSERGTLFSITLKVAPEVVGDGRSSLAELIAAEPRANKIRRVYLERFGSGAEQVPAAGERVALVFAGNHCQGTIFRDGTELSTAALEDRIDRIARAIPGFFFGRFDLRFEHLDDLLAGGGFKIIEINGASAEATHIWDADMSLGRAYASLFAQFRAVFAIGAANRRHGHRPIGVGQFFRDVLAYRRVARAYPRTR